jgi:uncharacterized membrane protein
MKSWEGIVPQLTALSLSIAVLGAVWAYLALGPLAGFVLVWAGFIAWGCFFHSGGDQKALVKTIVGTAYGAVIAWIALLIITHLPENSLGALLPAIVVGVTVFFLVIVASIEPLSAVPAQVYGYAATVAYSLHQTGEPAPLANLTSPSFANPLVLLIVSFVIGAIFGLLSGKLAGALTKKAASSLEIGARRNGGRRSFKRL